MCMSTSILLRSAYSVFTGSVFGLLSISERYEIVTVTVAKSWPFTSLRSDTLHSVSQSHRACVGRPSPIWRPTDGTHVYSRFHGHDRRTSRTANTKTHFENLFSSAQHEARSLMKSIILVHHRSGDKREPTKIAPLRRPKPTHTKETPRCAMRDSIAAYVNSCAHTAGQGKYEEGKGNFVEREKQKLLVHCKWR